MFFDEVILAEPAYLALQSPQSRQSDRDAFDKVFPHESDIDLKYLSDVSLFDSGGQSDLFNHLGLREVLNRLG